MRVVVANAADGEIVQELSGGSFFGEIAFLATCVHAFKVAGQDVQLQVQGIFAPRSAPLCTCLARANRTSPFALLSLPCCPMCKIVLGAIVGECGFL